MPDMQKIHRDSALAFNVEDTAGDSLDVHPRVHPHGGPGVGGASLTFLVDDPDCDMLALDTAATTKLRDGLTAILDAQEDEQ